MGQRRHNVDRLRQTGLNLARRTKAESNKSKVEHAAGERGMTDRPLQGGKNVRTNNAKRSPHPIENIARAVS